MRIFQSTFLVLISLSCFAQKYTPIHPSLSGDALLEAIVQDYKPNSVLSYSEARDVLYGEIDVRNDSVECVYSGHQVYLPPGVDPSVAIFMDGDKNGINAEHIFPRSKGAEFGNPLADMHHIFPCRVEVNTNRSSYPFAEIADQNTDSWYFLTQELSSIPSSNIDAYSEGTRGIDGLFEPRESRKGDIARAMFYFYTIYKPQADAADSDFFAQQMSTLCQWHELDPVDEMEYSRTFMIASYQDDKPNPYVLDCSLVERAYCQGQNLDCPELPIINSIEESIQNSYTYFPNPLQDYLFIDGQGEMKIALYDIHGRMLFEKVLYNEGSLQTDLIAKGIYILYINDTVYMLVK